MFQKQIWKDGFWENDGEISIDEAQELGFHPMDLGAVLSGELEDLIVSEVKLSLSIIIKYMTPDDFVNFVLFRDGMVYLPGEK